MKKILESIIKVKLLSNGLYEGSTNGSFNHIQLFGGTLVGHGISVGYQLVPKEFYIHNIHSYYIKKGLPKVAMNYQVEEIIESKRFRKIFLLGKQNNITIARFSMSFKVPEKSNSFYYKNTCTVKSEWSKLMDYKEILLKPHKVSPMVAASAITFKNWLIDFPFILKPVDPSFYDPDVPSMGYWFRIKPDIDLATIDMPAKHILLAFLSDFGILYPIILKHPTAVVGFAASLDHNIWFHCDDFDINQNFIIENKCLDSQDGLSLNIGRVWSEKKQLLMTVTQQGLIREKLTGASNIQFAH